MSNGQGCTCNAWVANECACGADWTPQEVYDLRAENNRLKAELKSIDGALDDPRANLTLTTAEIIWEMKAELAEAKKDAERYRWLRDSSVGPSQIWELLSDDCNPPIMTLKSMHELDAAIDEATKGK